MPAIPRDKILDASFAFRADPYRFVSKKCRQHGSDLFETRLLLRPTICMTGSEAARLFYDRERFIREGAAPGLVKKTLFGTGGVQGLDGADHLHRKAMLLSLVSPEAVARLADRVEAEWSRFARRWQQMDQVVLYDEVRELLTRTACDWAGVPLPEAEVAKRTRLLSALFDAAGAVGPRHLWSRLARKLANRWATGIVADVRADRYAPPPGSAVAVIADHRTSAGELLDEHAAAVELLNVVRPIVAVSVYVAFVAHALHEHAECRARITNDEAGFANRFTQEVRRFYPFFPAVVARGAKGFRVERLLFPPRSPGDARPVRHEPRHSHMA